MNRLAIAACLLLIVGAANGAPTTIVDTMSSSPVFDVDHWGYQGSQSWLHEVDFGPLPDPAATLDIQSATLTIRAYGVASSADLTADGSDYDLDTGLDDEWIETEIDLSAILADLEDGELAVTLNVTGLGDKYRLDWSELEVNYDWILPPPQPPQPPQPPVVPVPGAVVLAGIGTAFIGWLRRRQGL